MSDISRIILSHSFVPSYVTFHFVTSVFTAFDIPITLRSWIERHESFKRGFPIV
jgi:hypothetical protein